jgi:hypothetical protein
LQTSVGVEQTAGSGAGRDTNTNCRCALESCLPRNVETNGSNGSIVLKNSVRLAACAARKKSTSQIDV